MPRTESLNSSLAQRMLQGEYRKSMKIRGGMTVILPSKPTIGYNWPMNITPSPNHSHPTHHIPFPNRTPPTFPLPRRVVLKMGHLSFWKKGIQILNNRMEWGTQFKLSSNFNVRLHLQTISTTKSIPKDIPKISPYPNNILHIANIPTIFPTISHQNIHHTTSTK